MERNCRSCTYFDSQDRGRTQLEDIVARVLRRISGTKLEEEKKICIVKSSIICALHQILIWYQVKEN
jgi:hypothetical protein